MKKIAIAFAALIAAFGISSCNKEQIETPSTDIKLNISVADVEGSATKAAKTAWVAGDKINIWFDDWNYTEQSENHIPDMIIRYNGSSWLVDSQVSGLDAKLKANGKMTAVYEGYNDLSKYTYQWYSSRQWFNPATTWMYDVYARPMVAYSEYMDYSYADNIHSANLNSWTMQTKFKVLIKNDDSLMNSDAKDYALQVKNITTSRYANVSGAFIIIPNSTYPSVGTGSANNNGITGGVQEPDGIAFYFNSLTATEADIEFTLIEKGVGTDIYYTATNKTVTSGVMTNIAINHSKFAAK